MVLLGGKRGGNVGGVVSCHRLHNESVGGDLLDEGIVGAMLCIGKAGRQNQT